MKTLNFIELFNINFKENNALKIDFVISFNGLITLIEPKFKNGNVKAFNIFIILNIRHIYTKTRINMTIINSY